MPSSGTPWRRRAGGVEQRAVAADGDHQVRPAADLLFGQPQTRCRRRPSWHRPWPGRGPRCWRRAPRPAGCADAPARPCADSATRGSVNLPTSAHVRTVEAHRRIVACDGRGPLLGRVGSAVDSLEAASAFETHDSTKPETITSSERAQHLLRVLVESYIRDGQPVGSRTLSRESGLELSLGDHPQRRWPISRSSASSPRRTPRPGASRPTRATASSSTRCCRCSRSSELDRGADPPPARRHDARRAPRTSSPPPRSCCRA